MQIYQQEWDDGVAEKVMANASVAYVTKIQPTTVSNINIAKASLDTEIEKVLENISDPDGKSLASVDDDDLYYVQSILVSSSWNRNDDIFDKAEVWKAKNTPEDKPTNLEHDEDQIVGHIISNWPIDSEGNKIPENSDISVLPNKFHIVTGSVIYRNFSNPELRERAASLIQDIEAGKKFVSMECYFNNFDYGLLNAETGEYKILARNNNTSYLTKFLRSYGGIGEYDNHKIGRVLRNISFSGKGFVDKPANPESIIFDKDTTDKIFLKKDDNLLANNSVFNIQASFNPENDNMSLEKDVKELTEKVEAMTGCGEVLKEAYSRVSELEAKVMQLEATMKDKEEEMARMSDSSSKLSESVAEKDKLLEEHKNKMEYDVAQLDEVKANELKELAVTHEESIKAKDCDLEALKTELAAANEAIEAYKAKEAELARQAIIVSRVSELVESGVAHDVATVTVSKFEDLDDEAFATIKSLVSSNVPEWAQTKSEEVASEEVAETEEVVEATETEEQESETEDLVAEVAEEALETAEAEEAVDLSVGSDEDSEIDHTRASLVDFVYSRLGKQQSNKGE
jgi:hypothetical protein|tara:strand:- start:3578 stop:5290 length:1713 start_codon:yes stop_codon:yes gene_type:complete